MSHPNTKKIDAVVDVFFAKIPSLSGDSESLKKLFRAGILANCEDFLPTGNVTNKSLADKIADKYEYQYSGSLEFFAKKLRDMILSGSAPASDGKMLVREFELMMRTVFDLTFAYYFGRRYEHSGIYFGKKLKNPPINKYDFLAITGKKESELFPLFSAYKEYSVGLESSSVMTRFKAAFDGLSEVNAEATHPELLDELACSIAALESGVKSKFLLSRAFASAEKKAIKEGKERLATFISALKLTPRNVDEFIKATCEKIGPACKAVCEGFSEAELKKLEGVVTDNDYVKAAEGVPVVYEEEEDVFVPAVLDDSKAALLNVCNAIRLFVQKGFGLEPHEGVMYDMGTPEKFLLRVVESYFDEGNNHLKSQYVMSCVRKNHYAHLDTETVQNIYYQIINGLGKTPDTWVDLDFMDYRDALIASNKHALAQAEANGNHKNGQAPSEKPAEASPNPSSIAPKKSPIALGEAPSAEEPIPEEPTSFFNDGEAPVAIPSPPKNPTEAMVNAYRYVGRAIAFFDSFMTKKPMKEFASDVSLSDLHDYIVHNTSKPFAAAIIAKVQSGKEPIGIGQSITVAKGLFNVLNEEFLPDVKLQGEVVDDFLRAVSNITPHPEDDKKPKKPRRFPPLTKR